MRRNFVLVAAAFALFVAYVYVSTVAIVYGQTRPVPPWWLPLFRTHSSAFLSWTILCHTVALVLASIPTAFLVNMLYPRRWLLAALAIATALFVLGLSPNLIQTFVGASAQMKVIDLFDTVKLISTLPLLAWLFQRWSSDYRLART